MTKCLLSTSRDEGFIVPHSSSQWGSRGGRLLHGARSMQWDSSRLSRSGAELRFSFTHSPVLNNLTHHQVGHKYLTLSACGCFLHLSGCNGALLASNSSRPCMDSMLKFLSSLLLPWLWVVLDSGAGLDLGVLSLSRPSGSL